MWLNPNKYSSGYFLPISKNKTSIVYSINNSNLFCSEQIKNLIHNYNFKYKIKKINQIESFELKSLNLRSYYKNKFLAFGDLLHRIHPLAGQGFNMSLRDVKLLSKLIDEKVNLGLDIDSSICKDFQKNIQHKNYIFSSSIDLIYEMFNFEGKISSNLLSKSINIIGKNKRVNSLFKKFADQGLSV